MVGHVFLFGYLYPLSQDVWVVWNWPAANGSISDFCETWKQKTTPRNPCDILVFGFLFKSPLYTIMSPSFHFFAMGALIDLCFTGQHSLGHLVIFCTRRCGPHNGWFPQYLSNLFAENGSIPLEITALFFCTPLGFQLGQCPALLSAKLNEIWCVAYRLFKDAHRRNRLEEQIQSQGIVLFFGTRTSSLWDITTSRKETAAQWNKCRPPNILSSCNIHLWPLAE